VGMAVMLAVFAGAVSAISRSGGKALAESARLRVRNAGLAQRLSILAGELEQRVLERTAQLEASMSRERDAVRQLANSARLANLGTLAAGVAHEVNNPLTYVTSSLSFVREELAREAMDPEGRAAVLEALDDAATGVEKVRSIVRQLNDASRLDLRVGAEPIDLHPVLDFCVAIVAREIQARASLVREYGEVPRVRGDHTHLVQLFLNVLLNATEAISEGSPAQNSIRVSTRTELPSGEVVVEVEDSGRGIAEANLERIWKPFFTTKPLGHGFGLSICRTIVTGMGGRIAVRTREGAGTTFTVWLKPMESAGPTMNA
jgi:two-component system, NtrC family, sensor kinase